MNIYKIMEKYLPVFIKNPLIDLYQKWNSKIIWDKELIKDLVEYSHLSYDETIARLKLGSKPFIDFWNKLNPKTDDEIITFYKTNPYNVFSLGYWHMSRGQKRFRKEVVNQSFGNVLDYGGGIGDLSIRIAEKCLNVTYAEVNGENMEFAKWLFKKRGKNNITVSDIEKDQEKIWAKEYNTIVCIDVIEHIPHPEVVLHKMAKHLKDDGRLIITGLNCPGPTKDTPLHLKIDFDAEELLNSFRVFKTKKDGLWIKS